ncbi:ribosome biogenesis GTPase Der [Humitalea sp. 24SJ18S-53]|uniref:ribosome biogenesis GTPase Der n=1 Tax=Humitalea sp. 24SJ18S-53 TaxID=3422307 RepID=UPI003D668BA5
MTTRIAIVGRPNVGKSTIFNRLAGRRLALVDDTPGVTRDRKEAATAIGGRPIILLDTAGLEEADPDTIPGRMRASSETAIREADIILFVVDARQGLTPTDRAFARKMHKVPAPVILIANKAEGRGGANLAMEAYELGLGDPIAVSAEHGEGFGGLLDTIVALLPDEEVERPDKDRPLRLAIVGRPNAGKSTLLNALVGEDRMITGPEPGLTRDAVAVEWVDDTGGKVRLVDTAGLRKKARVEENLEKMSTGASIGALKECEVAVLVLDALLGLEQQDLNIARLAEREGRAIVLALNKWDAVPDRNVARKAIEDVLQTSLAQLKGITVVPMSAATGAGVEKLMPAVRATYERWNRRIGTGELNRWFEMVKERHQPPLVDGRRIKLRYLTMPKARPPTIVVFGTRAETLPDDWQRYMVNAFREKFDMGGVPIRVQLRGSENPYAEDDA